LVITVRIRVHVAHIRNDHVGIAVRVGLVAVRRIRRWRITGIRHIRVGSVDPTPRIHDIGRICIPDAIARLVGRTAAGQQCRRASR
jgi:hypothetical protein